MSTPTSNQNEPGKGKRTTSGTFNDAIRARLPRANGSAVQRPAVSSEPPPAPMSEAEPKAARFKFLPAFWTVASVMSITVNIILIVALLLMLQMFGAVKGIQLYASNQISGLLGGLYTNFVKMDQAHIRTTIHVEKEIPVQFNLNVSGPSDVILSRPVTIDGALVTVETGGLNIRNARATIVLPQGLVLPIVIQNLVVPVDQKVLAVLDVPVDIPMNQTDLHEPFVGLQKVVEPWYCFVRPNATVDGLQICPQKANSPSVNPTPAGTVIP